MIKEAVVLGLDTSNYTTSLALINLKGELLKEERQLLPVKKGNLGLRQSEALFQHIKNMPLLVEAISENISYKVVAIAGAIKPRPVEESYMPVFLAAASFGKTMGSLWKVPFYGFSHQEGHIEAGLWSLGLKFEKPFLALHLSGGTTELLKIIPQKVGYEIELLGGTSDISAGQFIDRIGVKLNLPFPSGAHLEALLSEGEKIDMNIPIAVKGTTLSFSGPETFLQRRLDENFSSSQIAFSIFQCIAKSLLKLIKNAFKKYPYQQLLIVGGVASNQVIKNFLEDQLQKEKVAVYFGRPKYCSDNAVGIGALGLESYLKKDEFALRG
ncbi:O-sialoglycoprotein endopeptidase [Clostridium formicaceticum]|uniref:N(6)-L-threonylcarbamoyladenine synthase n=1 Tax=Clostridium formicaceticum TaxID=1497 RepID=A0AAC9RIA0_9CLOT|nr:O-sialoglycoprotein endopeptidase [Clostridium formicaceticum]AOY77068.1 O-sialoglycoprotein endopeptidase [Clostridium formicaceticum]ARE87574.1 tRNA N6-adenosine threonylcarbamoyltransferase [Clostridium formicaceticum]